MTTENTIPEVHDTEVKNPVALLAKNKELLAKLKQAQEELATAQNALEGEKAKHSDTSAKLRQFRAEDPFKAAVKGITPHPGLMEKILREHMDVDVDDDGKAVLKNKAGEPLAWERKNKDTTSTTMPVELTADSMFAWVRDGLGEVADSPAALLHKAVGTGAPGNTTAHRPAPANAPSEPAKVAPPAFGLR